MTFSTGDSGACMVLRKVLTTRDGCCTGESPNPRSKCTLHHFLHQVFVKAEPTGFLGAGREGFANGAASCDVCLAEAVEAPLVLSLTEKEYKQETVFEAWNPGHSPGGQRGNAVLNGERTTLTILT